MVPSHEANPIELSKLWYRTVSGPVHPHGLFQIILPANSIIKYVQRMLHYVTIKMNIIRSVILLMTFQSIFKFIYMS